MNRTCLTFLNWMRTKTHLHLHFNIVSRMDISNKSVVCEQCCKKRSEACLKAPQP